MILDKRADLGHGDVKKLLFSLSVPTITSQIVNMLYNLVDRVFIGHMQPAVTVGKLALTGVGVCLPIIMVISAFASLMAIGGAPRASIAEGAGESEKSERIMGNCLTMLVITALVLTVLFESFAEPLLLMFGASENTVGYALDYMRIYALGTIFVQLTLGMNAYITAQGFATVSMKTVLIGALLNTALDPLFIFGFGWGIRGAAIATVLAQILALVWQFRIFSDRNELLHFRRGIYRLKGKIVRNVLAIGMSPFLMNLAACFIVILINKGLKEYGGDLNIGAYGIVNRLGFFFVMIVMGINQGMQPIAGYNYGARQFDRVDRVLKLTIIGATCVTTLGFLIGELAPRLAVSVFTDDPELVRLSAEGMRIVFFCFPIIGFQMVTTNFFQSIGMAGKAIFLSLSRQLLFLMPGLIFLPRIFDELTPWDGSWGVWCSMPLSDFLASLVAGVMLFCQFRKFKAKAAAGRGEVSGAEVENDRRVNE